MSRERLPHPVAMIAVAGPLAAAVMILLSGCGSLLRV